MHMSLKIMRAHLTDKQCSEASVGALYALLIGAMPRIEVEDWRAIHADIKKAFGPIDDDKWMKKLDRIKTRAWRLHDAVCAIQAQTAENEAG
ncbi:hypothetical protein [uncultured Roseibium sp.]|uniref:hypothetical protein n=1 Tax=uncultured Roseibium sp. TaxID=1936171 RepID=UPI00261ACACC|nr:hypothetical protein [uncultured Roseibium sp.]